nr:circumsporozoite protein-like [Aegilops tauschii subsp. strangulata]
MSCSWRASWGAAAAGKGAPDPRPESSPCGPVRARTAATQGGCGRGGAGRGGTSGRHGGGEDDGEARGGQDGGAGREDGGAARVRAGTTAARHGERVVAAVGGEEMCSEWRRGGRRRRGEGGGSSWVGVREERNEWRRRAGASRIRWPYADGQASGIGVVPHGSERAIEWIRWLYADGQAVGIDRRPMAVGIDDS